MVMQSRLSFIAATRAVNRHMPTNYALELMGVPRTRGALHELLVTESDGEYWFDLDSVTKAVGLAGLTEHQENVRLYTGHTHCPQCKSDLAPSTPPIPGQRFNIGFYDSDIDPVRIPRQFACKKCRHAWGPPASGPKDSSLVAVAAGPRDPSDIPTARAPRAKTSGGPSVRDQIHAILNPLKDEMGLADWPAYRAAAITKCTAAGINPGSTTTELPRWRKLQDGA